MSNQAKQQIQHALQQFQPGSLGQNGRFLLASLGYESDRLLTIDNSPAAFLATFDQGGSLRPDRALLDDWHSVEVLFQLTDAEISRSNQMILLDSSGKVVDNAIIESYLFVAIALSGEQYSRTQLAQITREVNKLFNMPVMLLLHYEQSLTLAIINRRLHKRDRSQDVLEKVTLIKDIRLANPHRAHIEILFDLSLDELYRQHGFTNFVELHRAWQKALDSSELNKRFFKEIADWYFWAVDQVVFPDEAGPAETRNATSVIRLITRLIFVWFIKEKGLIPDDLFNQNRLNALLTWDDPQESTYYKAILQNLFFATLNQEMNTAVKPDNRKFRGTRARGQDQHFMIHNVYRYERYFSDPQAALELFAGIPFLNGGLFECLDRKKGKQTRRVDGFSDRTDNPLRVPDHLFFGGEQTVDLNQIYDTSGKRYMVRGLIHILNRYKFTITENTPIEEEVALDPELLGKVFENLLAAYNPETGTTARKQTGSFYTPREIVNYMVDESLVAYLVAWASSPPTLEDDGEDDGQDARATGGEQDARATFFDPLAPIDIYQRNLPHWRQEGATYFVTFRLADSLPQEKLQQLREEREAWLKKHKEPYTPAEKVEYYRLFSQRVEDWLDAGMGSCLLGDPENGLIVAEAMRFFDGERYRLGEWVVMPNHGHVVVTPLSGYKLEDILHSWKSFTANKINRRVGRSGPLWQEESFDRIIRNEAHLRRVEQYIADNPRQAGITVAHSSRSAGFQPATTQPTKGIAGDGGEQDARAMGGEQDARATEERLRHLLAYNEEPHQFNKAETEALITAINRLKILDPACGSGAFPMGILHKLVFILSKLDPDNTRWKEEQLEQQIRPVQTDIKTAERISDEEARAAAIDRLQERLAEIREKFERNEQDYPRKLFLIENCIYGVDIQPVAVQIAKLRFFISLVVDQRLDDEAPNRGILPLPNLETKFVAANTLLGIEKPAQMGLRNPAIAEKEQELAEVRSKHFRARTPATKEKYRLEDKRLRAEISRLLQKDGFPNETTALLANWDPYDQNARADFFDREWMFGLERGFDIVIGNPPYVQLQSMKSETDRLAKQSYETFTRTGDIYGLFYEKGWQLLKDEGVLCFISSNKWMRAAYGKKLRGFFAHKTQPLQLIDFGDVQNFEQASVDTNILLFTKQTPQKPAIAVTIGNDFGDNNLAHYINQNHIIFDNFGEKIWAIADPVDQRIKEKVEQRGTPIKQWDIQIYRGVLTGFNKAFIVNGKTREKLVQQDSRSSRVLEPMLRGRNIKKWCSAFADQWIITTFPSMKLNIDDYPGIKNHLLSFSKARLEQSGEKGSRKKTNNQWFETQDQIGYWQEIGKPKILWADIMRISKSNPKDIPRFAYDESNYCPEATVFMMTGDSLKYLLALLNSKLLLYVFVKFYAGTIFDTGGIRYKKAFLENLPLPKIPKAEQKSFEELVDKILDAKHANPDADVSTLEQEIDRLVYNLYGIIPAEIALIEGRELSEEERPQSPLPTTEAVGSSRSSGASSAPPLLFTGQPPQGSFSEKMKRIETLTKQAGPAAIQELAAALTDDNLTIRWQAGTGLRTIGGPQVVGVLQAFIAHSDNPTAQQAATDVLEKLAI